MPASAVLDRPRRLDRLRPERTGAGLFGTQYVTDVRIGCRKACEIIRILPRACA